MVTLGNGTEAFFEWYFDRFDRDTYPLTGFWKKGFVHKLGIIKKSTKHEMGGAFHCIDLDGVYSLLRSSRNANGCRAEDVRLACMR